LAACPVNVGGGQPQRVLLDRLDIRTHAAIENVLRKLVQRRGQLDGPGGGLALAKVGYRERLPPLAGPLDQAFSALLDDLSARGLLDEERVFEVGEGVRARVLRAGGVIHSERAVVV
jgi:hypothetical protein